MLVLQCISLLELMSTIETNLFSLKKEFPGTLVHHIEGEDHTAAILLENKIKKRGIGRYLVDINFT